MGKRKTENATRRRERQARESERERAERRRRLGGLLAAAVLVLAATGALVAAVTSGGGTKDGPSGGPDLAHVHGLGLNPKDNSLYIATHTGLFRAAKGEPKARRVGESEQDVMGFSVLGPDRFLGSGHPGPLQNGPPNLGLISSPNAGRTWNPVSLAGEADFHVLRSKGSMVYGFNASSGSLMVSSTNGQRWEERQPPGPMLDLAIDPSDPAHVVASTEQGLVSSKNEGRSWNKLPARELGLLTWPESKKLYFLDGSGQVAVRVSGDAGQRWQRRGSLAAQPAAFASAENELYAALPDGVVKRSGDGGASWTVRATP